MTKIRAMSRIGLYQDPAIGTESSDDEEYRSQDEDNTSGQKGEDIYLNRIPPSGHLSKPSDPRANAKSAFAAKFDGYKAEGLVARRYQGELSATKQEGWQGHELGLREDPSWITLHHLCKLERRKLSVQVYQRPYTDKLNVWILIEECWEDIRNLIGKSAKPL